MFFARPLLNRDIFCEICGSNECTFFWDVKDEATRKAGMAFGSVRRRGYRSCSLDALLTSEQIEFSSKTLLGYSRSNASFVIHYIGGSRESVCIEYRMICCVDRWIDIGSGCTTGITPPHIKEAFGKLSKQHGLGHILAIKAVKH